LEYHQRYHAKKFLQEKRDICKTKLAATAESFCSTPIDHQGFSLKAEHFKTIRDLKKKADIVITRPDKGQGVVIMDKEDYHTKMLNILDDPTKFKKLGHASSNDNTGRIERSLQDYLRKLKNTKEIDDDTYQKVRPSGSTRPRMYGRDTANTP